MIILGAEIGMLIWGIIVLVRGKAKVSKTKEAAGAAARIAGVVAMLPIPLCFMIGMLYGVYLGSTGQTAAIDPASGTIIAIEVGTLVACVIIAMVILYSAAKPIGQTAGQRPGRPNPFAQNPQAFAQPPLPGQAAAGATAQSFVSPPPVPQQAAVPQQPAPATQQPPEPDKISFVCTCGKHLKVPAAMSGRKGRCPSCNAVVSIP